MWRRDQHFDGICIGGPWDGRRCSRRESSFTVFERIVTPLVSFNPYEPGEDTSTVKRSFYVYEMASNGKTWIAFWRHSELPKKAFYDELQRRYPDGEVK